MLDECEIYSLDLDKGLDIKIIKWVLLVILVGVAYIGFNLLAVNFCK